MVAWLQRHDIRSVVIGGMAEVLQGGLRPTYDVDLCYDRGRENLERLAEGLKEINATLRGVPKDVPFSPDVRTLEFGANFTFDTDLGPLDLIGWVEPIGDYEKVAAESRSVPLGEGTVAVLDVEALIRIKEHISRPKDMAALAELRAIRDERAKRDRPSS